MDIPPPGTYGIRIGDTFSAAGPGLSGEAYTALRYEFKPESVKRESEGAMSKKGKDIHVEFSGDNGAPVAFSGHYIPSKDDLDCVLVWDGEGMRLERVAGTVKLKHTRAVDNLGGRITPVGGGGGGRTTPSGGARGGGAPPSKVARIGTQASAQGAAAAAGAAGSVQGKGGAAAAAGPAGVARAAGPARPEGKLMPMPGKDSSSSSSDSDSSDDEGDVGTNPTPAAAAPPSRPPPVTDVPLLRSVGSLKPMPASSASSASSGSSSDGGRSLDRDADIDTGEIDIYDV